MFDTMTLTKIVGAICGAWLILLLGKWAADGLYQVDAHGEQSYVIAVAEDDAAPAENVAEVPFAQLYAAADAGAGERLWRQCQACHALEDGKNGTGPHLFGIVGRDIGAADGYGYSEVLASMDEAWTPENLSGFIAAPRDWAPGTKMSYSGLADGEDRANLIAYLNTYDGNADPASSAAVPAYEAGSAKYAS